MHFNFDEIKQHPYATGTVVIVGGLVVFYLLSKGSSGAGVASTSAGSSQTAQMAAENQLAQIQAGNAQAQAQSSAAVAAAQLQAQTQQQNIAATVSTTNTQTAAQLAAQLYGTSASVQAAKIAADAATTQAANQAIFNQNTVSMQDAVLTDQINSGVVTNANNNAAAIAGATITAGTQATAINDAATIAAEQAQQSYDLQHQQNTAYDTQIPYIVQNAGTPQNSQLDAVNQTAIFQNVLSHGTSSNSGNATTAATVASGNATKAAMTSSISSGASAVLTGLFG